MLFKNIQGRNWSLAFFFFFFSQLQRKKGTHFLLLKKLVHVTCYLNLAIERMHMSQALVTKIDDLLLVSSLYYYY